MAVVLVENSHLELKELLESLLVSDIESLERCHFRRVNFIFDFIVVFLLALRNVVNVFFNLLFLLPSFTLDSSFSLIVSAHERLKQLLPTGRVLASVVRLQEFFQMGLRVAHI